MLALRTSGRRKIKAWALVSKCIFCPFYIHSDLDDFTFICIVREVSSGTTRLRSTSTRGPARTGCTSLVPQFEPDVPWVFGSCWMPTVSPAAFEYYWARLCCGSVFNGRKALKMPLWEAIAEYNWHADPVDCRVEVYGLCNQGAKKLARPC